MNSKFIHIALLFCLVVSAIGVKAQCPSPPADLLFINAPANICVGSAELVLRTSKAKEANSTYIWQMPTKDTTTTDSVLVIKNPNATHSGSYLVTAIRQGCRSNPIGPLTVNMLGAPTLSDTAKKITVCGLTDTTISSKYKTINGITGIWSDTEGVEVVNKTSETTQVKNLKAGANTLIWTVSTAACRSFARDTFIVTVEVKPQMDADTVLIDGKNASLAIPLGKVSGSNINLLDEIDIQFKLPLPMHGTMTKIGKVIKYNRKDNFRGQDNFSIAVCSKKCKNLCSNDIKFTIKIDFDEQYPNVTLTGVLSAQQAGGKKMTIDNVESYPQNELQILNRWGNVLNTITDFNNNNKNWDGRDKNDEPLSAGAYYYIFKAKKDNLKPIAGIFYIID